MGSVEFWVVFCLCDCTHNRAVHSRRFPCPAVSEVCTALEGELPFADLYLDTMLLGLGVQINMIFDCPPVREPICSCSVISILLGNLSLTMVQGPSPFPGGDQVSQMVGNGGHALFLPCEASSCLDSPTSMFLRQTMTKRTSGHASTCA